VNASKSGFVTGFACVVATVVYLVASPPRQQTIDVTPEGDASTGVAAADTENSRGLTNYESDAIKVSQEHTNGDSTTANDNTADEYSKSVATEIPIDQAISDQFDRSAVENSNPETTSEVPEKQSDNQAATTTPERLTDSTATDFNHTPDGSPTRLSMPEQIAVANTTSEARVAVPGSSAAPDAKPISDYHHTPDPSTNAQDSSPDNQLSDARPPLKEPNELKATELTNERFWGPFNAELRAHSFAAHLSKLIEHPLFVVRDARGYHITFSYSSQSERESLRNRLTNAGLELDN